ncbi:MAG: tRNA lysidine(34) synthetase TilS [Candidatus Improbicoccus devescovinae]|nr:MAG: tRNA lysidine(34) synthetase TilS [Candidatus Improbicoccus devescovinae]
MVFEQKIIETIEEFGMFDNLTNLIVGVSGGSDSISLLYFLFNYSKIRNINLYAAHVNHNLRKEESDRDQFFVKNFCDNLKIKLFIKSIEINEIRKHQHTGIEECGRNARYDFFKKISNNLCNSKIATAHTLSDSIETIIFNFARGTGLKGMCGIPAVRENIIRPMIKVTKDDIKNYIKSNNISYISDSSNFSVDYARNKIRLTVIPVLKEINSSFDKNSSRFINQVQKDDFFLCNIAKKEMRYLNNNFNIFSIRNIPEAIRSRVLKLILEKISDMKNINYTHVDLVLKFINKFNQFSNNNVLTLPGGIQIGILNNNLVNLNKKMSKETIFVNRGTKHLTMLDKRNKIKLERRKEENVFLNNDNNILAKFELKGSITEYVFRTRLPGDIFSPPKRGHTKTLKKYFTELKIPVASRNSICVLARKQEIVWIENIGVSNNYLSDENSKEIVSIKLKNEC